MGFTKMSVTSLIIGHFFPDFAQQQLQKWPPWRAVAVAIMVASSHGHRGFLAWVMPQPPRIESIRHLLPIMETLYPQKMGGNVPRFARMTRHNYEDDTPTTCRCHLTREFGLKTRFVKDCQYLFF